MQYKHYIFDCDGVLLDSNSFKINAMREAVSDYPSVHQEEFIEYFKSNFGKSRYHHIEVFFNQILNRTAELGETEKILAHYASSCRKNYLTCSICEGALEIISSLDSQNTWVVSGSDEEELIDVFSKRGLTQYFKGILGSPTKKSDNIKQILLKENASPDSFCLIGDSMGDYEAALDSGVSFIFCELYSNTPELKSFFSEINIKTIRTLQDLA